MAPRTAGDGVLSYGLLMCTPALALFVAVGEWTAPGVSPALGANQSLENRVAAYLSDPIPYNAVFLGDSRTYCDIHPELLEPLVPGLHALNLSNFANWFPTQLSLMRDLVARIPPRTLVVWSIGHQNFSSISSGTVSIQRVYPIHFLDAFRLIWWNSGRVPRGLFDNVSYYQPSLHALVSATELHGALASALRQPVIQTTAATTIASDGTFRSAASSDAAVASQLSGLSKAVRTMEQQALLEPDVVQASATTDQGRITSIIRYFRRGGYYRTEVYPNYFRLKQSALGYKRLSDEDAESFKPSPPGMMEWQIFLAILDLYAKHGVRLVVNEVEEANFVYGHPLVRSKWRSMMRGIVQPEVERRGFSYIRTNLEELSDDDYFDFNHMNSKGIQKYMPLLAERLNLLMADR